MVPSKKGWLPSAGNIIDDGFNPIEIKCWHFADEDILRLRRPRYNNSSVGLD
jgi:hypothetical protein